MRLPTTSTKIILLVVIAMILVHMTLLAFYTYQHKSTQRLAGRDDAIQKVMNVIHVVKAAPQTRLARALETLEIPGVKVELSDEPKWPIRIKELTYWRINRLTPYDADTINLSLHFPDGRWINIHTDITPASWWPQLLLLGFEMIIAIIMLFYTWSINRFISPLKQFQMAAERLGVDMKTIPLEEYKGPRVVRETAQAMNKMQQRIQDLLNDRTQMLAAISHDLRTPITRLKLRANLIEDQELYQKNINDLAEMESMIAEILEFARNDHSNEDRKKLDLNSFIQSLCDDLADVGYPVSYACEEKRVPYQGRPLSLKRAIINLIQNAIKYGEKALVTLKRHNNKITLTIEDEGPGIPVEDLEKVFSPFYRCDHSRSRDVAGTGLGLAVARDAIRAHRGDIQLHNRADGGLCVEVNF